jgi:hypothetical protein
VLIVRMPQVAVGVECAKVFTASCFGMERGLDFCGNILGVHIVSQSSIKNDITAVHWRSVTSGEMERCIIGSGYR